jgi:hypothetical protein
MIFGIRPSRHGRRPEETARTSVRMRSIGTGGLSVTLLCNAVLAPSLRAQAGSTLALLPGSARAAGLGGAGAAIVGDAGAVFANPAALATIHRVAVEASYESYPSGGGLSTGAVGLRVGRFDWGAGAAALGHTYSAADLLGVSSLVFRTGLVALGTSLKYLRETVGGARTSAWTHDAGLAIAVFDLMALGVSVQNVGGDLPSGARLPRRTRAGFTMNYVDPQGSYRLVTTVEGQWASGGGAVLVLGVEGGAVATGLGVVGRVGYTGHSATTTASPFTLGGTAELGHFHLDYAYRADSLLGARHRLGLRWTP